MVSHGVSHGGRRRAAAVLQGLNSISMAGAAAWLGAPLWCPYVWKQAAPQRDHVVYQDGRGDAGSVTPLLTICPLPSSKSL